MSATPAASAAAPGSLATRPALVSLLPAFLALGWLVADLQWVWSSQPDMQFGWIVVMLSAYVAWENWPARPATRFRSTPLTALFALAGLGLLTFVQIYHAAFGAHPASLCGHAVGALLVAAASVHFTFGCPGLRHFGFPLGFLLVALPMPSAIQGPVTHVLQNLVATFNVEVLNLLGIPAQRVGSLIHLAGGTVGVNEACSGIRSLQSSIMATLFIGHLALRSNLLRVLLFAGGALTAVIGNVIRSLFLSLTANARGIASVNAVHDTAGWSILVFTAAGVAFLAWYLARIEKAAARDARPAPAPPPTPPAPGSPA